MSFNTFQFQTVPEFVMAWEGSQQLGRLLKERFPERRALIVTDKGLAKAGLIDPIAKDLTAAGFAVTVFDDTVADPPEHIVRICVEVGKSAGADLVIGLGGGSSIDIAKLVAILLRTDQPLARMYGIGNVVGSRAPLVLIPTTAGTGSEVTNISIITTGDTTKSGVVAQQLFADFVLLDAQLTTGLPKLHTAATGIDAMVHAIEAYTGKHKKNPVSDALAREALRLLSANLIAACENGSDRSAREGMLLGAMLAGQAFANSPVAAVHALAYPLGGHFHIPHGLSNALMLGPVLRFNGTAAGHQYAELADVLRIPGAGDVAVRSQAFITHMQALMDESGAPRRLRDVGVTDNSLVLLAHDAMKQTRLLVNNPIEVTEEDALSLYREAF